MRTDEVVLLVRGGRAGRPPGRRAGRGALRRILEAARSPGRSPTPEEEQPCAFNAIRPRRLAGVVALTAGAVLAATGASTWSRISGPTQPGAQLGLVRTRTASYTSSGTRARRRRRSPRRTLPTGSAAGTSTVATGFDGNGGLALLAMPDQTLRPSPRRAPGLERTASTPTRHPLTAELEPPVRRLRGGASRQLRVRDRRHAGEERPTRHRLAGTAAEGMPPSSIPPNAYIADQTGSRLATDSASGAVVIAGTTLAGKGGVAVQQILPGHGARGAPAAPVELGRTTTTDQRPDRSPRRVRRLRERQGRQALPLRRFGQDAGHRSVQQRDGLRRPDGRLWVAWGSAGGSSSPARTTRRAPSTGAGCSRRARD
jgi:hypothetical protein